MKPYNKLFKKITVFATGLFISTVIHANISIQIMQNHLMQQDKNVNFSQNQLIKLTAEALNHEHVNIGAQSNYCSVKVKLLFTQQSTPYLIIHLMSRYFASYKTMRINLTKDGSIVYPIQQSYQLTAEDFAAQRGYVKNNQPTCPAEYQTSKPLFVIGTPAYINSGGDDSFYRAVNTVSQAVLDNKQYQLVQLLDSHATIANYQNILSCPNLKYFFHIGGEDEYGKSFFLTDGDFDASFFSSNPQLDFSYKVISFVTCRAFDQVPGGFCPSITSMQANSK